MPGDGEGLVAVVVPAIDFDRNARSVTSNGNFSLVLEIGKAGTRGN